MAIARGPQKSRFYAGFYLRTRNRTRFWGWGDPPVQTMERFVERPWAQLADWLRAAHSFTQSGMLTQPHRPALPSLGQKTEAAQPVKRKFRFVCNKRFVGLVIQ